MTDPAAVEDIDALVARIVQTMQQMRERLGEASIPQCVQIACELNLFLIDATQHCSAEFNTMALLARSRG